MAMIEDRIPRNLPERSGVHICIRCLREVRPDEYDRLDHVCAGCAEEIDHFPLASTPESRDPKEKAKGEKSSG
jgi:hypothetical protein